MEWWPVELAILGPGGGFSVDIRGATVYSDRGGPSAGDGPTVAAMPYVVEGYSDGPARGSEIGISLWADHAPGDPSPQLRVIVTAADGTILLDRTVTALPVYVDALSRRVEYNDHPGNRSQRND